MRTIGKKTLSALAVLVCTSCINRLNLPDQISYVVDVSYDALDLFDMNVCYRNYNGNIETVQLSSTHWMTSIEKDEGFKSELSVKMRAKDPSGANLLKDVYTMSVKPDIICNQSTPDAGGHLTRASMPVPGSDPENVTFKFKVPGTQPVSVRVAPLKYNKHMVFCYTVDDASVNAWSRVFATINGRWIDNQEFFHLGLRKTTGYRQQYPLCFTDGCGNDRRFTFGSAIWPSLSGEYNPEGFILDVNKSVFSPYISWEELQIMTDMGNAVHWHNVPTSETDTLEHDVKALVKGIETDYKKTYSKIGYPMKVLAQPDGNGSYLEAALISPYVHMTRATTGNGISQPVRLMDDSTSLEKREVFGGFTEANYDDKIHELGVQSTSEQPELVGKLDHRPQKDALDFLCEIYDLYGKYGEDNIWVTTYDELYEYKEMTSSMTMKDSLTQEGFTIVTVTVPIDATYIFTDLSFVIDGAEGPALPLTENLYGFSSAVQSDGTVLVNCNFTDRVVKMAEKYVSRYEAEYDDDSKDYAQYQVSLLRKDLQGKYSDRIKNAKEPSQGVLPINGKYSKEQMNKYLIMYDGYESKVERQF